MWRTFKAAAVFVTMLSGFKDYYRTTTGLGFCHRYPELRVVDIFESTPEWTDVRPEDTK